MLSCFIAVIVFCVLFWVTYLTCKKKGPVEFSRGEILLFYIATRIVPLFMLQTRSSRNLLCLSTEWMILGLLYFYISRRRTASAQKRALAFYLFQPGISCFILSGNLKAMYLTMFVLTVLCMADRLLQKKNIGREAFLPEYLYGGAGLFLWNIATQIFLQHGRDVGNVENIPVAYIFSVCLMGMAVVTALVRALGAPGQSDTAAEPAIQDVSDGGREQSAAVLTQTYAAANSRLTARDFFCMAAFTLIFGICIFYRLGSLHTPETFETIKVGEVGENEIVLQFDGEQPISGISVYLGYKGKREISFSVYDRSTDTWEIVKSRYSVESAFCWNDVEIDRTVSSLGMVLMEDKAQIMEIVCLNDAGEPVLPANAADYPQLFDEQELFIREPTYYDETMFDEVYHGRTAYEFLHGLSIYENTHPPLGKSIISIGIALFGMNPFGWRFMCALFGTLLIPLMYLFARKIFCRTDIACLSAVLLGTAFMNTTLSRIATIDILVAFFSMLMFFGMYGYIQALSENKPMWQQRLWLLSGGISMGLAVAIKWTGVYAAAGIAVLFFWFLLEYIGGIKGIKEHRSFLVKTGLWCVLCFIVLPFGIYTLSYLPFVKAYPDKGLFGHMIANAALMLSYHSSCVFDHPYSSEWYQWLYGSKPLADSRVYFADGTVSVVMTFLNPLLAVGGLIALLHQFYLWKRKHCRRALFLIIAYASMLLPWLFVHRTVFVYQYFISSLILVLMIGNSVSVSRHRKRNILVLSGISIALYVLYYPVLTGQSIRVDFVNQVLEVLADWNIA